MGFKTAVINVLAIDRHGKNGTRICKKKKKIKAKESQKTCKSRSVENRLEHERKKMIENTEKSTKAMRNLR